ncbi:MAG: asparagine synthase-related protein, partial [Methermicoccaceae archaeon]
DEVLLSSVMRDDLEEVMKKSTQRDSLTLLSLGFTLNTPFLNPSVIEVAQNTPLSLKLYRPNRQGELQEKVGSNPSPATGGGETIRKYVLRRVALEYLPKELAYHPKQALQYSTGLIKAMHRLASKEGIARKQPARLRAYLDIF